LTTLCWSRTTTFVCFTYRDDTYHPDSSDKGRAEMIIAKHRNGPTAKIRPAFLAHPTRFKRPGLRFLTSTNATTTWIWGCHPTLHAPPGSYRRQLRAAFRGLAAPARRV
jgi:hypothetical protein